MKIVLSFFVPFVMSLLVPTFALACVVNLQCGQGLQLSWESQGVRDCSVSGPGFSGSEECSSPWVDANPVSGEYEFIAINSTTGVELRSTCQVNAPTNCGAFTISASPNPVQVCAPATQGTTNINWSIPSGKTGGIRVSNNAAWFVPAGTSGSGSQPAPWITPSGSPFVFTLFETTGGTEISRATVSVSTTNASCNSTGPQCGNGTVEGSEQCDAGTANGNGTSGCSSDCRLTSTGGTGFCGDSTVQNPNANGQAEQCDNGTANGTQGNSCSATCQNIGSGIEYRRCDATLGCVSAGMHASYDACVAANNGQACVTNCNACQQATTQVFYKCGTNSCETAGEYFDIATCNSLHGTCYTNLTCNNQCSSLPPTTINLGWANNISPRYDPTSLNIQTGQAVLNLEVNTGGRTNCTLAGSPGSQFGTVNSVSSAEGFQYAVANPGNGNFSYTLTCGTLSAQAYLTVSPPDTPSGFKCVSNQCALCTKAEVENGTCVNTVGCAAVGDTCNNSGTGFNCSSNSCQLCGGATGILCDGTGSGCTGVGQICTTPPLQTRWRCAGSTGTPCTQITCQGAECDGTYPSKSACEDATQCSTTPPPPTLGAQCDSVTVSPSRIVSGRSVSVVPTFRNMGSTAWSPGNFSARIIGATNGWPSPTTVFVTSLVAGAPTYGTFSPTFSFTAPSVSAPTLYPFSVSMFSGATAFSNACLVLVNGGPIIVYPPQCSDGIDNDDPEDKWADNLDPACIRNGTYDPNWDNERDPSPDAVLRISANPQLVRQGGRSVVTYEVNSCTVVDSEGNRVSAPWAITVDGASTVRSGVGDSGGVQTIDVLDIQTRLTYTLSCGGTSRSATISVIKINEF